MRVAIVAGEVSGDILGAGLIHELNLLNSNIEFVGIGGELMKQEGFVSDAEMDKLSIMGLDGLFENILDILAIRRNLLCKLLENPPDVFIGIDAPDFNLSLEKRLRNHGVPTVHYVSPTVWAWRGGRIKKIRQAVDLMLTLFPFEETYYQEQGVPVKYVGHPLAQKLAPELGIEAVVDELKKLKKKGVSLVAVLPGSRRSEVKLLGQLFIETIIAIKQNLPNAEFIIPLANNRVAAQLDRILLDYPQIADYLHLVDGKYSTQSMQVADVVLLASGTAALESALLAKPTVVSYKLSTLTLWYARRSFAVKYFSMPNHLLDEPVVPEIMQDNATVENLSNAVLSYFSDEQLYKKTQQQLATIHQKLNLDSNKLAAQAIMNLVQ